MELLNKIPTIWEDMGITLDEYARAFNDRAAEIYKEEMHSRIYFANFILDKPRQNGTID